MINSLGSGIQQLSIAIATTRGLNTFSRKIPAKLTTAVLMHSDAAERLIDLVK